MCVAVCCGHSTAVELNNIQNSSVLQCVAVRCSVLQCVLQCVVDISLLLCGLWTLNICDRVAMDSRLLVITDFFGEYRSLLQNIVSFVGFFCKRDLSFSGAY